MRPRLAPDAPPALDAILEEGFGALHTGVRPHDICLRESEWDDLLNWCLRRFEVPFVEGGRAMRVYGITVRMATA